MAIKVPKDVCSNEQHHEGNIFVVRHPEKGKMYIETSVKVVNAAAQPRMSIMFTHHPAASTALHELLHVSFCSVVRRSDDEIVPALNCCRVSRSRFLDFLIFLFFFFFQIHDNLCHNKVNVFHLKQFEAVAIRGAVPLSWHFID